jgi:SAM-dependent methyltransferase
MTVSHLVAYERQHPETGGVMAVACPIDLDTGRLRQEIQAIYARVATDPSSEFHFHRGPAYAAQRLGYDPRALAALPAEATASFAGVANPLRMAALSPGATVVDIGCGAGMDLMLAAAAVGPTGKAIGIDMTEPMAERARATARALGLGHVEVRTGDALDLPVDSESVDVVITNGVLNLAPDKRQAFGEVFRVLKPGGQFLYADIIVANELSESIRRDIDLWTG